MLPTKFWFIWQGELKRTKGQTMIYILQNTTHKIKLSIFYFNKLKRKWIPLYIFCKQLLCHFHHDSRGHHCIALEKPYFKIS